MTSGWRPLCALSTHIWKYLSVKSSTYSLKFKEIAEFYLKWLSIIKKDFVTSLWPSHNIFINFQCLLQKYRCNPVQGSKGIYREIPVIKIGSLSYDTLKVGVTISGGLSYCFFAPRPPMHLAASRCGALLIMPRPLLGCKIEAEIKGFTLVYCLFLYYQWFF